MIFFDYINLKYKFRVSSLTGRNDYHFYEAGCCPDYRDHARPPLRDYRYACCLPAVIVRYLNHGYVFNIKNQINKVELHF